MPSSSPLRRCRPLLGTFVEITAIAPDAVAQRAVRRAFAAIERVQQRMSFHDPGSDIGRLNRSPVGTPVRVHADTTRVLRRAASLAQSTGGAFDVTVGRDLVRWGFLPGKADGRRGDGGRFDDLELLPGSRVRRRRSVLVDLGGIAKGFAVDAAVRTLRAAGVRAGCVNAGGDLRVFGTRRWPVAVRVPGAPGLASTVVTIQNAALATSGGYLNRRRRGGRIVTPLLDGRTRQALAPYRSVSVVARTCVAADALTKIVLADPRRALPLLARFRAQALLLDRAGRATALPEPLSHP
jgi:thiamine biosynthesis lipoprotein